MPLANRGSCPRSGTLARRPLTPLVALDIVLHILNPISHNMEAHTLF